ncbi:MAG: DUF3048 domain-containing protein [Defluviitaleaceae bacterium]|nr:DUF3048 domain-containing protein [Defluviitaleaceae bacterium]
MKKFIKFFIFTIVFFIIGCGNNDIYTTYVPEEIETENIILEPEEYEPEEIDPFYGMVINPLTGTWILEEIAGNRPMAIVINNLPRALPQSGIGQADIIYEVLAEGGITRLIAIFTNVTADKVGPIRSTREYFAPIAINHNAVLIHHGGSPTGYNAIRNLGIHNLDGMILEGSIFFRDMVRFRTSGMREHSSYTNFENIKNYMSSRGFDIYEDIPYLFNFYKEFQIPEGTEVTEIVLPFSNSHTANFIFNNENGLFYRYQRGLAQIDEYDDSHLTVSNIIIKKTSVNAIPGDPEGRVDVNMLGRGEGYFVTAGRYVPIIWQRSSLDSQTVFLDKDYNILNLNPGSTWIAILPTNANIEFLNNIENYIVQEYE